MIQGGHAILLEVVLTPELEEATEQWVQASPGSRKLTERPSHITLMFLGRDLEKWVGDAMIEVIESFEITALLPYAAQTTGKFEMFGSMGDSLVMTLKDGPLSYARSLMQQSFRERYAIEVDDSFGFRPHVSLANGVFRDPPPVSIVEPQLIKFSKLVAKIGKTGGRTFAREVA